MNFISLLWDLVALGSLLLWGLVLCRRLRLPTGLGPVLGFSLAMVVLQLAGACNLLWPAAWLLLVAGYGLGGIAVRQDGTASLRQYATAPAVLGFAFACLLLEIVYAVQPPAFVTWDEFSHWGVFFKNVFYAHKLDIWMNGLSFMHQSYPQGGPALYALFALGRATYAERDVFFAVNSLVFATASSLFALPRPQSHKGKFATVCAALVAVPALFAVFAADTPYTTVYMDAPVGALFAACLVLLLLPRSAADWRTGLALGLLCAATATLKEIGAVFALCALGLWAVQCLCFALAGHKPGSTQVTQSQAKQYPALFAKLPSAVMALAAALLPAGGSLLIWKAIIRLLHRSTDQFSSMGLGHFLQTWQEARTGVDPYFYNVWAAFYEKFRREPLFFGWSSFKLVLVCTVAGLLLCGLLLRFGRCKAWPVAVAPLLMIMCCPCYFGVLFYVYIGGMSAQEALQTASYTRYAGSFFFGWFAVLFGAAFALSALLPRRAEVSVQACLCGLLAAAALLPVAQKGGRVWVEEIPAWRTELSTNAAALQAAQGATSSIGSTDNYAWLLCADADTAYQWMWYYHYELYPQLTLEINEFSAQASEAADANLTDDFEERSIRWLILYGVEDSFAKKYADVFTDDLAAAKSSPDAPVLYAVARTQDGSWQASPAV